MYIYTNAYIIRYVFFLHIIYIYIYQKIKLLKCQSKIDPDIGTSSDIGDVIGLEGIDFIQKINHLSDKS